MEIIGSDPLLAYLKLTQNTVRRRKQRSLQVDIERDRPKGKEEMGEIAKSTSVSLERKSGRLRMVVRE